MYKTRFFMTSHFPQIQVSGVFIARGISACLLLFSLFLMNMPVQATHLHMSPSTHPCAPNTPPPVSGTLLPASTPGDVMINEVLTNPNTSWNCQDPLVGSGPNFNSWIELYNPRSQPLDLFTSHAYISLDGGSTRQTLPFGSAIAPNNFLAVFPLENNAQPPQMWNIILAIPSPTGETILDQASIPVLLPDQSYGRIPDGSSNWQIVGQPTIDASNDASNQPITATPTKTSHPSQTATPTKIPKPTKGTSASSDPGTVGAPNTGTQPVGNQLQTPSSTAPITGSPATASTPIFGQSAPSASNTTSDAWQIAILISLLLLFCGTLLWGWRLFRTP
jgi:hypothetical protein